MGMLKNYLLRLQESVSEHSFGQEAVEHAVFTGLLKLTYEFDQDVANAVLNYDRICDAYHDYVHHGPRPIEIEFFKHDERAHDVPTIHLAAHVSRPPDQRREPDAGPAQERALALSAEV